MTTEDAMAWQDSILGQEPMTFGNMLAAFRECDNLTQAQVAQKLGISRQLLNGYETGRKLPSPELAYRMAQALGMSTNLSVLLVVNEQLARHHLPMRLQLAG